MHKSSTIAITRACAVTGLVLLSAGCALNYVSYDRETKRVAPKWETDRDTNTIPCYGSVEFIHSHGVWVWNVEGGSMPTDFYSIYFKKSADSSNDFFLKISKEKVPQEVQEAKGVVAIDGRSIFVDIEYKDANGRWKRPPINGHRKISRIYPDDLPGRTSLTK